MYTYIEGTTYYPNERHLYFGLLLASVYSFREFLSHKLFILQKQQTEFYPEEWVVRVEDKRGQTGIKNDLLIEKYET